MSSLASAVLILNLTEMMGVSISCMCMVKYTKLTNAAKIPTIAMSNVIRKRHHGRLFISTNPIPTDTPRLLKNTDCLTQMMVSLSMKVSSVRYPV